jgi:hypothetical protein
MTSQKPTIVPVTSLPESEPITIAKPGEFCLDKFKSKRAPTIAGVGTLQTALPHHSMAEAKDWVRLHPNEAEYWSPEFCFVSVPIKGQKRETLHLIEEELAMRHLPSGRIQRFRFALATKPHDKFFLCHVPSQNLDNAWNETNLQACFNAKALWTQAVSRKDEGVDGYQIIFARDPKDAPNGAAFPEPAWPTQKLESLIAVTFAGRTIDDDNHPGLLRLIGAKQSTS